MDTSVHQSHSSAKRRFIIFCASFAALYPIIRFLGFSIPRKPRRIKLMIQLSESGFHLGSDFILFDNGHETWALSRKCTHLGCTINYHEKEQLLECPCHQSRFSIHGSVLQGPAKNPLDRYSVERFNDDGGYIVTI